MDLPLNIHFSVKTKILHGNIFTILPHINPKLGRYTNSQVFFQPVAIRFWLLV